MALSRFKTLFVGRRGFTLIELLIVMAIIALLASISVFALSGARESARDAVRKADLEEIRSVLELYRSDCGTYPANIPTAGNSLTGSCPSSVIYKEKMPGDPLPERVYSYTFSGSSYTLCASLEGGGSSETGCGSCGNGVTCNYKTTNP